MATLDCVEGPQSDGQRAAVGASAAAELGDVGSRLTQPGEALRKSYRFARAPLARCRDRDEDDFAAAVLGYSPNLLRVAGRLAHNHAETDDLVQETLLKALRARSQFASGTNLKAWLLTILRTTFINRYRLASRERQMLARSDVSLLAESWIGESTLSDSRGPEGSALRQTLESEIGSALESIPEHFRTAVILTDVEQLSYREVADRVGCPIGTVMSRVHRGRRLLKARLSEQAHAMGIGRDDPAPSVRVKPTHLPHFRCKAKHEPRQAGAALALCAT